MLPPLAHHPSPAEGWHQREDRRPYDRHSIWTLITPSCYYQNFGYPADLPLAQPRFRPKACIRRGRQRFPQIERVLRPELCFVESPQDEVKGTLI